MCVLQVVASACVTGHVSDLMLLQAACISTQLSGSWGSPPRALGYHSSTTLLSGCGLPMRGRLRSTRYPQSGQTGWSVRALTCATRRDRGRPPSGVVNR